MKRIVFVLLTLIAQGAVADTMPKPDALFPEPNMDQVRLGQLLFYDPILSGNKTVSCATCHHPRFATSDGVSLGLGDGGIGLGPDRRIDQNNQPEQRIPRNSPALFNLGAAEFSVLFHDGRLEADTAEPSGFRTPLGADMEGGFDGVLSAQTMFPVLSPDEMAGHYSENDVAQAIRQGFFTGPGGAWDILAQRVADIPEYEQRFGAFLPAEKPLHFADISNAIAAFMAFEWRADNSRFDQFLRGKETLSIHEETGLNLFYGSAGCSVCHSGQFQTDHKFHAIGIPQIGPGKAARFERHTKDEGRLRVTGQSKDAFAFRTPSLRNVTHTAPYGHSGAYKTLEAVITHHADATQTLKTYDRTQVVFPDFKAKNDFAALEDARHMSEIATAITLPRTPLSQNDITSLIAFLRTLDDETALKGRLGIPETVPSGLPVQR
ncbi:cytochrome c peroxidase [Amylibacter sp. IMCC11727]|uniref:cytochrome-c peroxidase n=1 Tax=Amylibacter sp. IMCC11727 TaxID=3039851 RepID=UPI00244DD783|nr:cytochrome c peroxidase [Amylibacter sp. IMCC11727]WGI23227.1 cytochrome c peroxidase [Amylibacter sp. IMCC11727]